MTWRNSKQWQDNSDGWVTTMNKSKEDKEAYKKYISKTKDPITYRDWLRERNDATL
tara:strand:- start:828 stop:995 length:168 start_codon:yes stop_codon:yes gene_type:complete